MAVDERHPFRVFVNGLRKGRITRYDDEGVAGIQEEDDVGWFFQNRGCNVEAVRLVLDPRSHQSRGFGFVDFADEESRQRAILLAGCPEAADIVHSGKSLVIEAAQPKGGDEPDRRAELLQAQKETEQMERDLRFKEAQVMQMEREIASKQQRAAFAQSISRAEDVEERLAQQRRRQEQIREQAEKLEQSQAALAAVLRSEEAIEAHTTSVEGMLTAVDEEQTRRHAEAAGPPDFHMEPDPIPPEPVATRVRNTFIECYVPPMEQILRTCSAPDVFLRRAQSNPPTPDAEGGASAEDHIISPTSPSSPSRPLPKPWASAREADAAPKCDRQSVRLRNVPILDHSVLNSQLRTEITQLWRRARGLPAPPIEAIQLADGSPSAATVTFVDPSDAVWLVDGRVQGSWCAAGILSLRGHLLQVDWPESS